MEILHKESEWKLMSGHVEEFIVAALLQLGLQASRRMGNGGAQHAEKLYTSVISSLNSVRMLHSFSTQSSLFSLQARNVRFKDWTDEFCFFGRL